MLYMLDTNTLIYVLNARPQHQPVLRRFNQHDPRDLCVSAVSWAELQLGAAQSVQQQALQANLALIGSAVQTLPFDAAAAEVYGSVRADLKRLGTPIGPLDMLIASHALSLRATLVSNNLREFGRVVGLQTENWIAEAAV